MATVHQITANRENSQKSTGPSTPEGKKRSALNAIRHNFTGQVLILTKTETPLYLDHCREYRDQFSPQGKLENELVQQLADQFWSLRQIRAQTNNLFTVSSVTENLGIESDDEDINSALAAAQGIHTNAKTLALLSIYEQRKERSIEKTLKLLKEAQETRKWETYKDLRDATQYREAFEIKEPDWVPSDDGFVCSLEELHAYDKKQGRAQVVLYSKRR
jgi:hypothetical protein